MARLLRSYVGTEGGGWLLFVRQRRGAEGAAVFALKALVALRPGRYVLAELSVGAHELAEQIDALGLEIGADAFAAVLSRALDVRERVSLEVGDADSDAPASVTVAVTYKFSESISRKGCFELPVVATDVPAAVVEVLADAHALPHRPVLSAEQLERQKKREQEPQLSTAAVEASAAVVIDAIVNGQAGGTPCTSSSQSQELDDAPPKPVEQRAKRKQVPTGTIRRKAAKGAKLFKR